MSESRVASERWRAGRPLAVGTLTLLPIERVVTRAGSGRSGLWFSATKTPHAIVIRDRHGIRAVDAQAVPVSLEQLREQVPDLDAVLASA